MTALASPPTGSGTPGRADAGFEELVGTPAEDAGDLSADVDDDGTPADDAGDLSAGAAVDDGTPADEAGDRSVGEPVAGAGETVGAGGAGAGWGAEDSSTSSETSGSADVRAIVVLAGRGAAGARALSGVTAGAGLPTTCATALPVGALGGSDDG